MAFTLSHMAAALPFYRWRKWISVEALLIGTMLPDLPYFLNSQQLVSEQSHQWMGLLTYCLPWGLGLLILWYSLLKPAAIALAQPWYGVPASNSSCLHSAAAWLRFGAALVMGLLLGASTHLIWDGITHPDGFIARHVIWLQLPINISNFDSMPLARFLQYASSMMGLVYLGWFIKTQVKQVAWQKVAFANIPIIVLKSWVSLLIITIVCAGSLFCAVQAMLKWHSLMLHNSYLFLAKVLVGLLQGAIGLFIIYALAYQLLYGFLYVRSRYTRK